MRKQKRRTFKNSLFCYDKLEPKNLLAGVVEPYSPSPITDPFVQDAVTYEDMVGRAATMPYMEGELIVAISAPLQGNQFENYLSTINWSQMLGQDAIGVSTVDVEKTMMTVERGTGSIALVHLSMDANADLFAAMRQLDNNDAVLWSSPNFYQTEDPRELVPNDPDYGQQYHHPLMSNEQAWDITLGSSDIIVGITDDGVELFHTDLLPNIYQNDDFPFDGIDNDGNGYIDDANGWDFINANNDPNPDLTSHDHGTHVAGIAAAATNNNIGISGTAGGATIMPLQFYNYGAWPADVIAETFTYAADNGAHIVSTSYNINGWVGDPVFTAGMQYMYDAGVLALNSAGNGSELNPARQAFHQTLLVVSSEADDTLSGFTNYGTGVDIVAPGGSIYSTVTSGGYGFKSGTSMAAPNAAGVAALIWSANPTWTRDQVAAQLVGTGDNIDAQNPTRIGWMGGGRVNSFAALTETLAAPQIESVTGLPDDGVFLDDTTIDEFSIRFSQIMDPASINTATNFDLRSAGLDDVFGTADDQVLTLDYNDYMISTNELVFTLTDGPMNYGHYQLTVSSGGIQNPFGESLDGNGDGTAGDDYTQEFYISPPVAGIVGFDRGSYLVEDTIVISLGDANAVGPITVDVTSTAGDSETVTLTDQGFGRYEGTINTMEGSISTNDGVLQVALGHQITVTYQDADDGTGNPATSEDTAVISNVIQFDSIDIPVQIGDNASFTSVIPIALTGTVGDLDLQLDITHTWDADLDATLTSPSGTVVQLFDGVGGDGDNFENTYFDDEATTSINDGSAPFAGDYQPDDSFANFDTESITGDWILTITDSAAGDTGTLNAWSLFIDVVPASLGQVSLNQTGYNVGNTVEITVTDDNATTPVSVDIEATSGDMETVVLTEDAPGIFVGSIVIADETVSNEDGVLQGSPGVTFTATYQDADDGSGNPFTSTAEANITNILRFDSTDTPIQIDDNQTFTSIINVPNPGLLVDLDLQLDITHTWDADLDVFLIAPDGTEVELFSDVGGSGDNFENTYLDDEADTSIADGTAPFTGSYRPIGSFSDFDGSIITGDWTLSVTDDAGGDQGTLNGWSLFMDVIPATVGTVRIDADGYNVGETVEISVFDENAAAPISVDITATSGDSETVVLTDQGSGLFTGSIVIEDTSPASDDGLLQGSPGTAFTVTYVDLDDGNGNQSSDSVNGRIQNVVHYVSPNVPLDIVDNTTITSELEILDEGSVADLNVELDITHTFDADLDVFLIAPDGTRVELFTDVGGSGENFTGTILDADADVIIANGGAPFTGSFQPEGDLTAVEGMSITGIWTLEITDDAGGDTGTLDFWCLTIDVAEPGSVIPNIVVQGSTGQVSRRRFRLANGRF